MRSRSRFIAFALFLVCAEHAVGQTAAPGGQKARFTMSISLQDGTVKPGSEVLVTVALTNTSGGQIQLWQAYSGPPLYTVQVLDRVGKAAPMTAIGKAFRKGDLVIREEGKPLRIIPGGSGAFVSIAPGETAKDVVSIESQFDLSQPGAYSIQLERIDPATKLLVKSNVATLSVAN